MSIRVFISHSTSLKPDLDQRLRDQVPGHTAFRRYLCNRLEQEPGIEVVHDDRIPVSYCWRRFLFEVLAGCSAGVVLVNEQALHHSPWVDTEVKVLACRAHNEKGHFLLIVIPFGGMKEADIAKHVVWEPVAVDELQMLPRNGLNEADFEAVDQVVRQVIDLVKGLPDLGQDTSLSGWLVARLCALLPADTRALIEIGTLLGADDVRGIAHPYLLSRRVARVLYERGPAAIRAIQSSPHTVLDGDRLRLILDVLRTHWVDIRASVGILSCCRRTSSGRVVAINGREVNFTPAAYIRQVCGRSDPWPVFQVDPTAEIVDQIRHELSARFRRSLVDMMPNLDRAMPEEVMKSINRLLGTRIAAGLPVFVTVPQVEGRAVDDLIKAIQAAFPDLRVVVCSGTEPNTAVLPPQIQMLTPELDLKAEEDAWNDYLTVLTEIQDK